MASTASRPGLPQQPGAVPRISEHALCTDSTDGLYFCKFSPSDEFLAASDARGEIHVLQNKRTPATSSTSSSSNIKSVFEPLPYTLKCGTGRGGLQTTSSTPISVAFTWRPESEQVSQKSVLTVVRTDGYIQQFHAATGRSLHDFNAYEGDAAAAGSDLPALYCVDYAPDGSCFAAGGKDPEIFVFDEMSKKQLLRLQRSDKNGGGHSSRVCAAKFSNPNLLVTGGWDCTLQFWDLRKGSRSVANLYGPSILGAAGMDIFGSYVVAGSHREGKPLQCYDMRKLVGSHFPPSGAEKATEAAPVGDHTAVPCGVRVSTAQVGSGGCPAGAASSQRHGSLCMAGSNHKGDRGFLRVSDRLDLIIDSGACTSAAFGNRSSGDLLACTARDGVLRVVDL